VPRATPASPILTLTRKDIDLSTEPTVNGYGIFNRSPLIIHIFRYLDDIFPTIEAICGKLGPQQEVIFVVSLGWSIVVQFGDSGRGLGTMANKYFSTRRNHPKARIIYLANDMAETYLLRQLGMEAVLCQHNAFLSPASYALKKPSDDTVHDSLYIARLHPYKRVELMESLQNSALIYGSYDEKYYSEIKEKIRNVKLLNDDPIPGKFRVLSRDEVLQEIRRSAVGLCLSYIEGAMFASAEYLLAGIPIVSTYSVGGRDAYFDPRIWFMCEPTPASVADAVGRARAKAIAPSEIRARTIELSMSMRLGVLRYLREEGSGLGREPDELTGRFLDINTRFIWKQQTVDALLTTTTEA
jgi:glycosyltransferase involved in cell wall biosynthesis